jgi:hypothetical protein
VWSAIAGTIPSEPIPSWIGQAIGIIRGSDLIAPIGRMIAVSVTPFGGGAKSPVLTIGPQPGDN